MPLAAAALTHQAVLSAQHRCLQAVGAVQQRAQGARLVSVREEVLERSAFAAATLRALSSLPQPAFQTHLARLFPLLTSLISCPQSSPEVQRALVEVFTGRIGPLLSSQAA